VPLVAAGLALTPATVSSAGESTTQAEFTVKSSLDGKTVLPHRIVWVAFPSLGRSKVVRVDFFIDGGRVRWSEPFLVTRAGTGNWKNDYAIWSGGLPKRSRLLPG